MGRIKRTVFVVLTGVILLSAYGALEPIHSKTLDDAAAAGNVPSPLLIEHKGSSPALERAPVAFDHDRHTKSLSQGKKQDCGLCHVLQEKDAQVSGREVAVFKFPKTPFDAKDKKSIMFAYHEACVSCHVKKAGERKKSGPPIGLCGKCHARKVVVRKAAWGWKPIFNYARHDAHLKALSKIKKADRLNIAGKVEPVGEVPQDKNCQVCHHTYDAAGKKLVYKKDTENSCNACHKAQDEKNARSMKTVAHAACIGCHMKLAEEVKTELIAQGRKTLTDQDKKRFGPYECGGCHGEHKELKPTQLVKIPRLFRGQKDVMEVFLKSPEMARMKVVPYNHKAHEPRVQFCNTCHHHSLEKCSNCHTPEGDLKKGGGVPFERAFHKATARQACVGCHNVAKQDRKCSGCHQKINPDAQKASCHICHRGSSHDKPVDANPVPLVFDKEKVPEKVMIKTLAKEFKPADLPHQKIIVKLTTISNENSLARVFHAGLGDQTLCSGCHHRTDPASAQAKKLPKCESCHGRRFESGELGRPGILAAYHQQCMGCHKAMRQKPPPLECQKCHPAKEGVKTAEAPVKSLGRTR